MRAKPQVSYNLCVCSEGLQVPLSDLCQFAWILPGNQMNQLNPHFDGVTHVLPFGHFSFSIAVFEQLPQATGDVVFRGRGGDVSVYACSLVFEWLHVHVCIKEIYKGLEPV